MAMNHCNLIFLITFLLVTLTNGFPQSLSEVAVHVKQTDLNYYHQDVRFIDFMEFQLMHLFLGATFATL